MKTTTDRGRSAGHRIIPTSLTRRPTGQGTTLWGWTRVKFGGCTVIAKCLKDLSIVSREHLTVPCRVPR